ncbi:PLP-dependent aminotransferase family protein [Chitinophaga horti]|uniref:PLP-dependent aminotransferase family protein n=1 Tax=Chitinophaga horti TaxID=2920382 RepID=A0ABY6J5N9_9BACT|nr:PLP-dependent aminotransferase family protein [Chitinophaga horti]UYQ94998.1 PLP-dependent aminotransferase family protein [Chitinophaga horti]
MLPYKSLLKIDAKGKKPRYEQLAAGLHHLINKGLIPPGTKLPSSRLLAELLQLHRKTVTAAYEELIHQGWISSKNKSGYYVNPDMPITKVAVKKATAPKYPAKLPVPLHFSNILPPAGKLQGLFLDDGLPDPRIAPYKPLLRELRALTDRPHQLKKLNHGTSAGSSRLARALAAHLADSRGIHLSAPNIYVTNGGQMGIYLVSKALLSPGDVVLAGAPGYSLANQAFTSNGARVTTVPVDEHGINVDKIGAICKRKKVKAVYVIPHHHYPTTVTLSPERRMKLLALSEQYNFIIIEDDYDYDYHYASAPHLPMASYHHQGRVVYIGSLSKSLSASLRLGFIAGTEDLIGAVQHFRKMVDIRSDILLENAVANLFEQGEIARHTRKANKLYKERRDYLCRLLDQHLGNIISYRVPDGGMSVWMKFPELLPVRAIGERLQQQGISFHRHMLFDEGDLNHMRLGFASLNFGEINKFLNSLPS